MIAKAFLLFTSLSGLLAVAFGAFGAHGLKARLDAAALSAFQAAVQYQFYHTLALLGVAILLQRASAKGLLMWSGYSFVAGILLFSGSLYIIALGGPRWLGPVTPLGGLAFMFGWLLLFVHLLRD